MTTGLWALASGWTPGNVIAAIPPACRREVGAATVMAGRDEALTSWRMKDDRSTFDEEMVEITT